MKVYIIILHFGDTSITKRCIMSLGKNEIIPFTILIINNTETTITQDLFTQKTVIINNHKNIGFSKGINNGITYALKHGAEYILLLNNDTVIEKPFLSELLTISNIHPHAIIAPAIKNNRNGVVTFDIGGHINKFFGRTTHKEVSHNNNLKPVVVDYASGCCLLLKKEIVKKIGLFDERYFLYYEDVDFCLRAKKGGFLTYVVPSVFIAHDISKTIGENSAKKIFYNVESAVLFGKTYYKKGLLKIFHITFLIAQNCLFTSKNISLGKAAWSGFFSGISK